MVIGMTVTLRPSVTTVSDAIDPTHQQAIYKQIRSSYRAGSPAGEAIPSCTRVHHELRLKP